MAAKPPNRIPWPPLVYLAAALLGFVLNWQWPLFSIDFPWARQIGSGLLVAGIGLDIATMLAFRRHHTTIMPHRAASALITTGPFSFSRNPIYLANTLLLAGLGLAFEVSWVLLMVLPAAWITQKLAIEREERHLAETFGEAWTTYAAETPRWLVWL